MSKSNPGKPASSKESPITKSSPAKAGSPETQLSAFDKAMKLFHNRDFHAALPLFDEASSGADLSVAHAAQLHARMCRQRLERESPQLKTSEDNYTFGLALAGRRDFAGAEHYLQRALNLSPRGDHVLYSLALVKGMQGDIASSAAFLSRAIDIQPNNRHTARTDPDFHDLLQHQLIRDLVF